MMYVVKMTNIIIGANSKLAKQLTQFVDGQYLSKEQFNLHNPTFEQFNNIDIDHLIILAKSRSQNLKEVGIVADSVYKLLTTTKYNHAWVFTSGMGTYWGSNNSDYFMYSCEKMLLTFISYKQNFIKDNIHVLNPGYMGSDSDYANIAKKFSDLLLNPPEKNLIWSLSTSSYNPY